MPLSEFLRLARGKLEAGQPRPCPPHTSARPGDELVELVWENGQIMMQGQSSRVSRNPSLNNLSSNAPRIDRDARLAKFGGVESILNDILPVVPTADLDLSQDDEMVPWLSYHPIDVALPQGYGSELLPEISGITSNGISTKNSLQSGQTVSNFESGGNNLRGSFSRARPMQSWLPQQSQTSDALGSGVSDIISNNTFGNQAECRDIVNDATLVLPTNKSSFLNFSHFSKSGNFVKPSLGIEDVEFKEKGLSAGGSNPVTFEQFISTKKDTDFNVSPSKVVNVSSRQPVVKVSKELFPVERIDKGTIGNSTKGVHEGERGTEQIVTSSSVGSGNSADRVSCEQTHNSKRNFHDVEESECRSDDIETESVGVKKATAARGGVGGSKRSRAAEVHNLSERRRRDRINEKMRALQELIPNCNKADKASMLDEAIEYLKTLQLQVQIMSMGAGLCMPQMMYPPGMQHMHPAHYSAAMGVGMGMTMGFGMGMLDMNIGGSLIYPVPQMQVPHFPSPMAGPTNFPRIPGPLYGHPGQGLPNSGPRPPLIPLPGRPPLNPGMGLNALRNEVPNTSQICNAEAGSSMTHKANQLQGRNEVLAQSAESK